MLLVFRVKGHGRRTLKQKRQEQSCALCGFSHDDPPLLGEKVQVPELGLSVHYLCLLTSCGVFQRGEEHEGVFGFLVDDIKREMRRSSRLTCSSCKHKGACVGCFVPRCTKKVHFPCGRSLEFVSQFRCPFPSFCPDHAPTQSLSPALDLSLPRSCSVCLDHIEPVLSFSVLKCPACHSSWFHRDCVQRQAHSSGLFFFRCTLCNNKDQFQDEMLRLGIHVPERDASWELESGAFSELLEVYESCDSVSCECPEGRGHSAKSGYFGIIRCRLCGSRGTHRKCSGLRLETRDWACPDCTQAIDGKPALMASPSLPQKRSLSRLSSPAPVCHKRSRFSASEASPQQLLHSLRPRPRLQHQVTFRLRPRSNRTRPLADRRRPLLEVGGDDALGAALELVRRRDFDPMRELSVRFKDERTAFPRSPGGDGALRHFLDLLLRQIQNCDVFEGPENSKNLALNAQALKEDLYFDVGVLLALALVYGAPRLAFFSPALYQLLFNFPQNQALTSGHMTPGSPLTRTVLRMEAARSVSELQTVISSCSDHLTLSGCNRPIRSLDERAGLVDDLIAFSMITRMQLPLQRFREGLQTLGVFEQVQLYPSMFLSLFTSGADGPTLTSDLKEPSLTPKRLDLTTTLTTTHSLHEEHLTCVTKAGLNQD
ncbi:G2/M phase-specific E3 ubiquitin-protein ligase [Eucyclogobius newberryi]|uniref:G2/M phase-specific E3 ubiquitin-protein ligase n=1 Tax=Eucyclogobius newberryi TaxID=166745 RepID=UPI003B59ADAB